MTTTITLAFSMAAAGACIGYLLGVMASAFGGKNESAKAAFQVGIVGAVVGALIGGSIDYFGSNDVTNNEPALRNCISIAQEKGSAIIELTPDNKVICSAPRPQ